MTGYAQRWLLAVAMKQPYPALDVGALSDQDKQTQRSALVISGAVAAVGLLGGLIFAPKVAP
jgi:hypothetical protein